LKNDVKFKGKNYFV